MPPSQNARGSPLVHACCNKPVTEKMRVGHGVKCCKSYIYILRSVFGRLNGDAVNRSREVLIWKRSVYRFVDRGNVGTWKRAALGALRFACQRRCGRSIGCDVGRSRVRRWRNCILAIVEVGAVHFLFHLLNTVSATHMIMKELRHTEIICFPDMTFLALSSSGFRTATNS